MAEGGVENAPFAVHLAPRVKVVARLAGFLAAVRRMDLAGQENMHGRTLVFGVKVDFVEYLDARRPLLHGWMAGIVNESLDLALTPMRKELPANHIHIAGIPVGILGMIGIRRAMAAEEGMAGFDPIQESMKVRDSQV